MSAKKGLAIGCGLGGLLLLTCFGGCGALLFWVYKTTSEAAVAADQYLAQLGRGDISGAYNAGSTVLQGAQDRKKFELSVRRMRLNEYTGASFPQKSVVNNVATLEGTMTTRSGFTIPIKVSLSKEGGVWKVNGIDRTGPATGSPFAVPADEAARELVLRTMDLFASAARKGDFTEFHAQCAGPFKVDHDPAELKKTFGGFGAPGIDLVPLKDERVAFSPAPSLSADQDLALKGHYMSKLARVEFDLTYFNEDGVWKIIAINVQHLPRGGKPAEGGH